MKRVLVLLPGVPEPADTGAKLRNRALLAALGARCEIDAIAFGQPEQAGTLGRLVDRAVVVPPPERTLLARLGTLVATEWPDMAARLWAPEFAAHIRRLEATGQYAAVQAEGIEMARYLQPVAQSQRVYDAHNAEFLIQQRFAEGEGGPASRVYSRLQWQRLARFERAAVQHSRLTLAVSRHDANQLIALAGPSANVAVVHNGLDVGAYPFQLPLAEARPSLLFLGKLDFRPNADAVRWFLETVMPEVGEMRLFVVGGAPPTWLVRIGQHDARVAVTGYVPDERDYLRRCTALVLPVQTGGGSRLKALVAMASGLPIVSTRVGMEGLDVAPGEHYLLAETPREWIAQLTRLHADPALRQRLARAGRARVEARYDWAMIRHELWMACDWLAA